MNQTLEVPIRGMDCAECTAHVRHALMQLPGVESVEVYLASEKAVLQADPARVTIPLIRNAVAQAGYSVPDSASPGAARTDTRNILTVFALVFGAVLLIVVAGEWLGLLDNLTARIPGWVGLGLVLLGGYPVFLNVIRAALKGQVLSHTLMTLGVVAALVVGEWTTAVIIVFFMRIGNYVEQFTTGRARRAVQDLTALAPQTARVERQGELHEVPLSAVSIGETIVVFPGEMIPADGTVLDGQATINQATITGEPLPVEAGAGSRVFAATHAQLGRLRIRVTAVGQDTTFGQVIKLVEEAEGNRANVQQIADKFSAYYLPVVAAIAALTFLLRRDALAVAAVLVVACSCSFALATPIAMLASIGAGARRGLLVKGGKYLELLARADVLLVDKTGTLTLGRPEITDIVPFNGLPPAELLRLAASAERYSEHPLAGAVRAAARARGIALLEPLDFHAVPGQGVSAMLDGRQVQVGRQPAAAHPAAQELAQQGKTLLWVTLDGQPAGVLAAADTLRPEVPAAFARVRGLGIRHILLLTGDHPQAAAALAQSLEIDFRAGLLPEDKIAVVRAYQQAGHVVVMVGDGVNDAPALAQADVGIAMGAAGSDIAVAAASVALMREDWNLVPQVFAIARRTMRIVRMNIIFTTVYNLVGLTLAAFGILPPVFAAAAQSLPDIGILANSSRLIKQ